MLAYGAFFDKRLIPHHKRKYNPKKQLPQIRQPMNHLQRINLSIVPQMYKPRITPLYPLLSNFLISKKINPTPMDKLIAIIQQKDSPAINNNFLVRRQSVERKKREYKFKSEHKRCNTSISRRENDEQRHKELQQIIENEVKSNKQIKFMILGTNNNQELVRQILKKRNGWRQIAQGEGVPDFKWVFYKAKHNYKKMGNYVKKRVFNHFQFNHQICTKDSLIKNLQLYCQTKKIQLFSITPITFILDFDNQYCNFNLKQFLGFYTKNDPRVEKNHTPIGFLGRIQSYMSHQNPYIKKVISYLSKPVSYSSYYYGEGYVWLLKPTGLNRGRGIELFSSLQQLQKKLQDLLEVMGRKKRRNLLTEGHEQKVNKQSSTNDEMETNSNIVKIQQSIEDKKQGQISQLNNQMAQDVFHQIKPSQDQNIYSGQSFQLQNCSFVIQKYVQRPLLISDRKFDIRVWALLTHQLQLYFYKHGYLRLAAQKYSTENLMNPFVHLTNNAIQKHSPNYGQYEDGNQLGFQFLGKELGEEGKQQIWKRMKQITHMVFCSVKKKINMYNRKYCFQIFGLDFMVDYEKRVWLIQVNENPCIECTSPLLADIIPKMVDGALILTADAVLTKSKAAPNSQNQSEKQWQLLGRLKANCTYKPNQ